MLPVTGSEASDMSDMLTAAGGAAGSITAHYAYPGGVGRARATASESVGDPSDMLLAAPSTPPLVRARVDTGAGSRTRARALARRHAGTDTDTGTGTVKRSPPPTTRP